MLSVFGELFLFYVVLCILCFVCMLYSMCFVTFVVYEYSKDFSLLVLSTAFKIFVYQIYLSINRLCIHKKNLKHIYSKINIYYLHMKSHIFILMLYIDDIFIISSIIKLISYLKQIYTRT